MSHNMVFRYLDEWEEDCGEGGVEEKFEKYFGYLARCEAKFCTTTLKTSKNHIKINQNAGKMPSKFENWALKTLIPNLKSGPENP